MSQTRIEKDLDVMFEELQNSFSIQFSGLFYHVKVTQVKDSFYVLIRKKYGKVSPKTKENKCLIR